MVRYPEGHKAETRARILDAARRIAQERGFAATGVSAVMRAAGLTHGGFYAHFRDKEELLSAVVVEGASAARADWQARLAGKEGLARLETLLDRYLDASHVTARAEGCPLAALLSEVGRPEAPGREAWAELLEDWVRDLAPHLPGQARERSQRARAFVTGLVGAIATARALPAGAAASHLKALRADWRARLAAWRDEAAGAGAAQPMR